MIFSQLNHSILNSYDNNKVSKSRILMRTNGLSYIVVTSISKKGKKVIPDGCLQFMPVACYAFTVGENTLKAVKSLSACKKESRHMNYQKL